MSSRQQEAAARTRQALFETTEARQEAQRYWRQARTDDLTRLPNRRFIEEELPRLVDGAALGQPLVVAIVDADHFKRVNDTFSHEVGDRVICELARVLQAAVAERGEAGKVGGGEPLSGPEEVNRRDGLIPTWTGSRLVARLGGEEFLIVLPGLEARVAANLLENVRLAIARHGWDSLVGQLPVTVSIGATAVLPHDSQSDLLARADRYLYAAKRAGRNRVVVDFGDAKAAEAADLGALYSDGRSAHSRPEGM
jgi:PleD family two-component response regulator